MGEVSISLNDSTSNSNSNLIRKASGLGCWGWDLGFGVYGCSGRV